MAVLTFTIEPDEFRGLNAIVELGKEPADGQTANTDADVIGQARALMRSALAGKLAAAGLSWAPSAEAVEERAADTAEPTGRLHTLEEDEKLRRYAAYVLAAAGVVALWGGYGRGWQWTGFKANGQLWNWLGLLLLPVVLGTIPLWIQDRQYIGKGRRVIYGAFIVAWTGFVIVGYLVPIGWTGFRDQKLWNWIELLVLPGALAITTALTSRGLRSQGRLLRPSERTIVAVLLAGWVITVIGGYALRWTWTGYHGNTLWDWLSMLLVPLVFPTILLPALLKWISGNAAGRASQAHAAPVGPAARPAGGATA